MSSIDLFSMAVRNLFKRKLRSFLTILGVIIGTAAIVVMVSLGVGMNQSFEQQLSQMGDLRVINVMKPYDGYMGGGGMVAVSVSGGSSSQGSSQQAVLDDTALQTISEIPGVSATTPLVEGSFRFVSGKVESWMQVRGIRPEAMKEFNYKIAEGRLLEDGDKLQVVYGGTACTYFYSNRPGAWRQPPTLINPMEDSLQIHFAYSGDTSAAAKKYKPIKLETAGVLEQGNWETDYYAFMPLDELQKIVAQQKKFERDVYNNKHQSTAKGYDRALVKCAEIKDVTGIMEQIIAMGFMASSPTEYLEQMQQTSKSLQGLLGAIGGVSLFIAAIGITNTMMMSIYERTREIGVMKVIGAAIKDIRKLFLVEASLIGLLGGIAGVGLSYGLAFLLNNSGMALAGMFSFLGDSGAAVSVIPLWLALLGLGFSTFVGIVSGYFPARRAMKISAITAIRQE